MLGPTQRPPERGSSSPASTRASTVLPAPLGPTTPTRSPRVITSSTSSSTGSSPNAKSAPSSATTRWPPRAELRSSSAILRRSNTGRSTFSIVSIWRCLTRACLAARSLTVMCAQWRKRRTASSSRAISLRWVTNCCCWRSSSSWRATV